MRPPTPSGPVAARGRNPPSGGTPWSWGSPNGRAPATQLVLVPRHVPRRTARNWPETAARRSGARTKLYARTRGGVTGTTARRGRARTWLLEGRDAIALDGALCSRRGRVRQRDGRQAGGTRDVPGTRVDAGGRRAHPVRFVA